MDYREEFRRYIRAVRREFEPSLSGHLTEEALIDYQQGRLREAERESVQSHLVQCAQCIEVLKDVGDFFESDLREGESISETEMDRKWQRVWRRVEDREPSALGDRSQGRVGFWRAPQAMFALAATLFLAFALVTAWALWLRQENQQLARVHTERENLMVRLTGLEEENRRLREQVGAVGQPGEVRSAQSADLAERVKALEQRNEQLQNQISAAQQHYESQLAQLRQPALNSPIYDLLPRGAVPRSVGEYEPTRITLPPTARNFVVILHVDSDKQYPTYGVEIVDPEQQVVWQGERLSPNDDGNLVMTLDRGFFGKGEYRFKLYGRQEQVAEYVIVIE